MTRKHYLKSFNTAAAWIHVMWSGSSGKFWYSLAQFLLRTGPITSKEKRQVIMAQCVGAFCWQASLQRQLSCQVYGSKIHMLSSVSVSPFLVRTTWEDLSVPRLPSELTISDNCRVSSTYPAIVCFRDDDAPELPVGRDLSDLSARTSFEVRYSPWAMQMLNGYGKKDKNDFKESTGSYWKAIVGLVHFIIFIIFSISLCEWIFIYLCMFGPLCNCQGLGIVF